MIMRIRATLLFLFSSLLVTSSLNAQPRPEPEPDTIRVYRLGNVVVSGRRMEEVSLVTINRLSLAKIDATDASTASEIAYRVPGARVQTNSRGEALLYLRGAGERQLALFFDGALLNVPWDNRFDLSLLPLNAVGEITVTKGVPSVLYGANVSGGAVNVVSQELREPGYLTEIVAQGGGNSLINVGATTLGSTGAFNYVASAGYVSRKGVALPDSAALFGDATTPFSRHQSDPKVRTNSDARVADLYLRGEYHLAPEVTLGASFHLTDAEKGVAPEGHRQGARFWRYPEWRNMTATINGEALFGEEKDWQLRGALWWTSFKQSIDDFTSATYELRRAREEDQDGTIGTRLVLEKDFSGLRARLALNGLQSTHEQRDLKYDSTGALLPYENPSGMEEPYPTLLYTHQIYSTGLELESDVTKDLVATVGGSFDGMATPKTGDKPARDGFSAVGYMGGLRYQLVPEIALRLTAGQKSRFPTMRELYGEALNRFLLNPDLKPESTTLTELAAEGRFAWGGLSVIGFANRTMNTIDQRTIDSLPNRPRQRINLPGSRALGVEVSGDLRLLDPFRIEGHLTYLHARVVPENDDAPDSTLFLSEKPEIVSTVVAEYTFPFGLQPSIEMVHTSGAYSLNDDNIFVPLGSSTVLNGRIAYRLPFTWGKNFSTQLFLRVNNITNEVVYQQLGLPSAGREIQGGVKATF